MQHPLIRDGFYQIVVNGESHILRITTVQRGGLAGRTILLDDSPRRKHHKPSFAFLEPDGTVRFFLAFESRATPEELEAIRKAIAALVSRHSPIDKLAQVR